MDPGGGHAARLPSRESPREEPVRVGGRIVARVQAPADHRIAEEDVDALAGLADDRARLEAVAEDAGGMPGAVHPRRPSGMLDKAGESRP